MRLNEVRTVTSGAPQAGAGAGGNGWVDPRTLENLPVSYLTTGQQRDVRTPPPLVIEQLAQPVGLRITGEIDMANHQLLRRALNALPNGKTFHFDLTGLEFIDVAGVTDLAQFTEGPPPRRLVLHSPPPQLRRITELLWPTITWEIDP